MGVPAHCRLCWDPQDSCLNSAAGGGGREEIPRGTQQLLPLLLRRHLVFAPNRAPFPSCRQLGGNRRPVCRETQRHRAVGMTGAGRCSGPSVESHTRCGCLSWEPWRGRAQGCAWGGKGGVWPSHCWDLWPSLSFLGTLRPVGRAAPKSRTTAPESAGWAGRQLSAPHPASPPGVPTRRSADRCPPHTP